MHPYLAPHITSYGALLLAALIAAWLLARRQAKAVDIPPAHIDLLAPLLVLAGLGGAVLFGNVTDLVGGAEALHGRVLYGGLLAAVFAGIGYALVHGIPLGDLGDAFAAPIGLGIAIGRLGCFFAGCCWGKVCAPDIPLAVRFPPASFAFSRQVALGVLPTAASGSRPVHPTQLYESAGALILALALLPALRRRRVAGSLFLVMALAYAGLRFAVEFLRDDNLPVALGLTVSQWICLGTAVAACATLLLRRRYAARWHLLRPPGRASSLPQTWRDHG